MEEKQSQWEIQIQVKPWTLSMMENSGSILEDQLLGRLKRMMKEDDETPSQVH